MNLHWFISRRVREAHATVKHVRKLLNHQRDLLTPQAVEAVEAAMGQVSQESRNGATDALAKSMQELETVANKWIRPYPNAAWRENVEVLVVALAVAMGIRTFFLQPFKIPTGSMQPTLFGVTSVPDYSRGFDTSGVSTNLTIPTGWERVKEWFQGVSYVHVVAKNAGEIRAVQRPWRFLIFNIKQTLWIDNTAYTIWFPPDYGSSSLEARAGLQPRHTYQPGEDVVKLKVVAGDHLFVDRLTYNFRPPKRGEIIVFETKGIPEENRDRYGIPGDQFYIKRLIGLGGETIQLGSDRHVRVNGKPLTASMPHFERVYSFDPKSEPKDSHYSGHVYSDFLAPFFQNKPEGVKVPPDHYLAMGDNTMNSLDSRAWGPFPSSYVIGKGFFVYWPLTDRFGWGYHR